MKTHSLTLKHPIEIRGKDDQIIETISTVQLVEPRGKQMRAFDNGTGEMSKTMALIAACASVPPSTVDLMHGADIMACAEVLAGFLGVSLLTGEK